MTAPADADVTALARRIAKLGRVDDEILRDVIDRLGTFEVST